MAVVQLRNGAIINIDLIYRFPFSRARVCVFVVVFIIIIIIVTGYPSTTDVNLLLYYPPIYRPTVLQFIFISITPPPRRAVGNRYSVQPVKRDYIIIKYSISNPSKHVSVFGEKNENNVYPPGIIIVNNISYYSYYSPEDNNPNNPIDYTNLTPVTYPIWFFSFSPMLYRLHCSFSSTRF